MTTHASGAHVYVHGSPRWARRRRVWRNRVLLVLTVVALGWSGHAAWPTSTAATERTHPATPAVDEHAPTGSDSLDGLTPRMRGSVQAAIDAAAAQGVRIEIVSAARSAAEQEGLYEQAIARYGSAEVARRWVLPPEESEHVRGGAVDVGPRGAATWLEEHGVEFGLCRRYRNEWWHFERLAGPRGARCPAMEAHAGG